MVHLRFCLLMAFAHAALFVPTNGEIGERPSSTTLTTYPRSTRPPERRHDDDYHRHNEENHDDDKDKKKSLTVLPSNFNPGKTDSKEKSITLVVISPTAHAENLHTSYNGIHSPESTPTPNSSAAQAAEETTMVNEIHEDQSTLQRLRQIIIIAVVVGCVGTLAIAVACFLIARRRARKKAQKQLAPTGSRPEMDENPFRDPDESHSVEQIAPANSTAEHHDVAGTPFSDLGWGRSQPELDDPFNSPEPSAPSAKELGSHDHIHDEEAHQHDYQCRTVAEHPRLPLIFADDPPPSYTPSAPPHYALPPGSSETEGH